MGGRRSVPFTSFAFEAIRTILATRTKHRRCLAGRQALSVALGTLWLLGVAAAAIAATAAPQEGLPSGIVLYAPADIYTGVDFADQKRPSSSDQERPSTAAQPGDVAPLEELLAERVRAGRVSAAFRVAAQICTIDPDHAVARRVLGYHPIDDAWGGGYARLRQQRGETWHSEFGWIRPEDQPSWERGLRPWGKRWVDAEEDRERHETLARGWTLRTDHFFITTNHSRGAAVELAARLEQLYQLWRQLFGEMAVSARELEARLAGKTPAGYRRKPFRVWYHRTREQYNQALRPRQPQIDRTLGIYFDRERETHFFAGEQQHAGTIYHEAVHQFFYESTGSKRRLAVVANAWATEGIACYFESLTPGGGQRFLLGAPGSGRLPAARHRLLIDDYYVPLAELSSLGMDALQSRPDLPRIYSQSAGLATFLMHYDEGAHRDALRELLAAVYAGRDDQGTLQRAAGQRWIELDRQYRQFLEALPPPVAR